MGSDDYSALYYHDHLGPPYTYEEPHWRNFFGGVADRIIALLDPRSVYDAGCALGFLVRALRDRDVDAFGGDISEYAVAQAPAGLAEHLEVKDLTEPFGRRYDLITCIEVLEHLDPLDARTAIANLCAATDQVLMSSTPDDFAESTHVNVQQPWRWAQEFAAYGFYRRTDVDATFLTPWAVVFAKQELTPAALVARYEALLGPVTREVLAKRQALLDTQRRLDDATSPVESRPVDSELAELIADRDAAVAELDALRESNSVAARLALVDELIGTKAELAQVRSRSDEADHARVDEAVAAAYRERDRMIDELHSSFTWRIGRVVLTPVRLVRRLRAPRREPNTSG